MQALERRRLRFLDRALVLEAPCDDGVHDGEQILARCGISCVSNSWRCCARFCSVMSRAISEAPITAPELSSIGDTVSEISIASPFLRSRTVS